MGPPLLLLTDKGTVFLGHIRQTLSNLYIITMIQATATSHYHSGLVERQPALLKRSMESTGGRNSEKWIGSTFTSVCASRNISPLSHCSLAPRTIVTGRSDYSDQLLNLTNPSDLEIQVNPPAKQIWDRPQNWPNYDRIWCVGGSQTTIRQSFPRVLRERDSSTYVPGPDIQT